MGLQVVDRELGSVVDDGHGDPMLGAEAKTLDLKLLGILLLAGTETATGKGRGAEEQAQEADEGEGDAGHIRVDFHRNGAF